MSGKAALGSPHAALYNQLATVPSTCVICSTKAGYDTLSGLGTPNITNLMNTLAGAAVTAN